MNPLTPVSWFGSWCAKREDMACISTPEHPSGSKVRQYLEMAKAQPGAPMLVGASANSCMQVYVASASVQTKVPGIVYIPARAKKSEATEYCYQLGIEVNEVRPGYPSVYKKRSKERGQQLGSYVRWNPMFAAQDTVYQCQNIPEGIERVVVPTGTGLTAAGVLAGLAERGLINVSVFALATSTVAKEEKIKTLAEKLTTKMLPKLNFTRLKQSYDKPGVAQLPDNTPLDPFYAAKALPYVQENDCLWLTGLRPICAMPKSCQQAFRWWWWSDAQLKLARRTNDNSR